MDRYDHAKALIDFLVPNPSSEAMIEITTLLGRRWGKRFFTYTPAAIEYAFEANEFHFHAYVGVNPHVEENGKESAVPWVTALFLDFDLNKDVPANPTADYQRLSEVGLIPSAVVCSGGGYHLYFKLVEPVPRDEAKLVWRRLCDGTTSDRVFNVNRIARLPGTTNWKPPPTMCRLDDLSGHRYTLHDLSHGLDLLGVPKPAPEPEVVVSAPEDPLFNWDQLREQLSPPVRDLIQFGIKHGHTPSRSEADFAVISELVRLGATNDQIKRIFDTTAIGALKYRKKGTDGVRYLNVSIDTARRKLAPPVRLSRKSSTTFRPSWSRLSSMA